MKNAWFPIPIIIAIVALAAACGDDDAEDTPSPSAGSPAATTAAASPSATPQRETPTPDPDVCQPNPDPGTPDVIQVDTPADGASLLSPAKVSGMITAFEGSLRVTVFDAGGAVIADITGQATEGQVFSPFSVDVPFDVSEATPACIWVNETSAVDGGRRNIVQIPVLLRPAGTSVCQPNPDPATPDIAVVDAPLPDASSSSPLSVTGQFAAFEAQFRITLYDAAGNAIADKTGHTAEGQMLSPFSDSVPFTVSAATPACLWVYENSARDGSPIHVVQVPVTLLP